MAYTTKEKYKTLDFVKYNLSDDAELNHYNIAKEHLEKMECISKSGGTREYKAYGLNGTPTFPTHKTWGYEHSLNSGSVIHDIETGNIFMYTKLMNNGEGGWHLL